MGHADTLSLFTAWPQWMKMGQYIGLAVSAAAMLAASQATAAWHLVVTIGVFYPFAGGEWSHPRQCGTCRN
jgi:hypothetical protein